MYTKNVCEHNSTNIQCGPNEAINVIEAWYGRQSNTICSHSRASNVSCSSDPTASLQIVQTACQDKQSCNILASNGIFGDPCNGTYKYMALKYECVPSKPLCKLCHDNTVIYFVF